MLDQKNKRPILILLLILPIIFFFASLFIGAYSLTPPTVIKLLISKISNPDIFDVQQTILFDIRLPRIVLALLIGCALSVSSACYQASFRNPLVSEYILGVSAGAAFGASLSIIFLGDDFPVQVMAFAGGIIAVMMTYFIARIKGETGVISLVLAGIITNAVFTGGSYVVRYLAEPEKLHILVVWLMGSLSAASWKDVSQSAPFIISGSVFLILLRWRLNLLSMGDEEAKALGVDTERFKIVIVILSTLISAVAISVAGIIGWIGLMVPHIIRMLIGSDNRIVLPLSATTGAAILLMADNIVRMSQGIELPVGVLTTLIGAPFFIYLIRKSRIET